MNNVYLESVIKQFEYYKMLGEKTFNQIEDQHLFFAYNSDSNNIAMIVNHLSGNMISRFTDFLNADGEKAGRNRDAEFEDVIKTKELLVATWDAGWICLFNTLRSLNESDLDKIVYIRNERHTVVEAINRQLAHYPYHIGQIVFLGKMLANNNWQSLSVPKGCSQAYNAAKFKANEKDLFK